MDKSRLRVLAMTSGRNTPSARFRFRQYYNELSRNGLDVVEACPLVNNAARLPGSLGRARLRYLLPVALVQALFNLLLRVPALLQQYRSDLTWLERHFVPGADILGVLLKRPYVLDIDDAVWLYNPFGERMTALLVSRARGVVAGNTTIAAWCGQFNRNVVEIPTAIDCERFTPNSTRGDELFIVGWTGTSANFEHLHMIEEPISAFLAADPQARLRVVADRRPKLRTVSSAQFEFVKWNSGVEAESVATMDIGVMPLPDNPVTRGKCSFKMLQYMACSKAVVVSPVGLNAEILAMAQLGYGPTTGSGWLSALRELRCDPKLRDRLGHAGRQVALQKFDVPVVAARLTEFLRECADR